MKIVWNDCFDEIQDSTNLYRVVDNSQQKYKCGHLIITILNKVSIQFQEYFKKNMETIWFSQL